MYDFQKNINALISILSDNQRRILAIYYDNIITADRIEALIDESFPQVKKIRIKLSQYKQKDILPLLNEKINTHGDSFVYIYDLEHVGMVYSSHLQKYMPTQFLTLLNLQREKFFASTSGKIIFFVKKAFVHQLRQSMADFWDWIFYHFDFSLEDFETSTINISHKRALYYSALTKKEARELEKAIRFLLKEKNLDRGRVLNMIVSLIHYYIQESRVSYATEWVNKAVNIAKQLNNYEIIAQLYESLANYFIKHGNWKKGEKYLSEAVNIRKKYLSAEHKDLGHMFNKLAFISKMQGDLDKAKDYYSKVAKEHINIEKILDLAQAYCDLAKVFIRTHQFRRALDYSQKALALRQKVLSHDSQLLAQNYYQIAKIYYHLNKTDLVKKYLTQARQILKKLEPDTTSNLEQSINSLFNSIK